MIFYFLLILVVIWEAYWTFRACWLASKNNHKWLFLFFLLFNLLGIPEIIYVYKQKKKKTTPIN